MDIFYDCPQIPYQFSSVQSLSHVQLFAYIYKKKIL